MRGLAPAGEVLSFARPKESTQRKGRPAVTFRADCARNTLRASGDAGFFRQAVPGLSEKACHPWLRPCGPDPRHPAVLGATDG